jgi:anthranilate/para-aminobenzoate synthase component II
MNKFESVGVLFPENSECKKTTEYLKNFTENNPVEFTAEEEVELIDKYAELEKSGLHGVLHIIHKGSPTGDMIAEVLPKKWREKYYHRLHIVQDDGLGYKKGSISSSNTKQDDIIVSISKDGKINSTNKKLLEDALRNRVGIISGGGPGSPNEAFFIPLINEMEKALKSKTPAAGICLGHQLYGKIVLEMQKQQEAVSYGYLEGATSIENITPEGKDNALFQRLGEKFNALSFNELHVVVPNEYLNKTTFAKVLTRSNATNYPTSLSINADIPDQIITTQRHPEFGMLGTEEQILKEDQKFYLPSGTEVIVPAGCHPHLIMLAKYFTAYYNELKGKYHFTEKDIQELFLKERMSTSLGKNFYGPLVNYFADIINKQYYVK